MDRIEKIINDPFYCKCLSLNDERERDRLFCRHDFSHMFRVSLISYKILIDTGRQGDIAGWAVELPPARLKEIVYAAGLLHDIGRWRQYDTGEDHAGAGAVMAGEILARSGFSGKEARLIARAISEHRRPGPRSGMLGRVLCLADDLSRPCLSCGARFECYKYDHMENIKEKNLAGYVLDSV
ncbi:MAG: HD domain-containing protein [Bacillota bacterium]